MGKVVLIGLLTVAASACGRFGFEPGDEGGDADVAPNLLSCGLAPKFSIGATTVKDFIAVPTSKGFVLFSIDTQNELRGWSWPE